MHEMALAEEVLQIVEHAAAREGLHRGVAEAARGGAVVLLVTHDARPWAGTLDGVLRLTREGGWTVERMERAA